MLREKERNTILFCFIIKNEQNSYTFFSLRDKKMSFGSSNVLSKPGKYYQNIFKVFLILRDRLQ
jgi:hypothetical protein